MKAALSAFSSMRPIMFCASSQTSVLFGPPWHFTQVSKPSRVSTSTVASVSAVTVKVLVGSRPIKPMSPNNAPGPMSPMEMSEFRRCNIRENLPEMMMPIQSPGSPWQYTTWKFTYVTGHTMSQMDERKSALQPENKLVFSSSCMSWRLLAGSMRERFQRFTSRGLPCGAANFILVTSLHLPRLEDWDEPRYSCNPEPPAATDTIKAHQPR
mmetsp:Transcript_54416/g.151588  ORF Transcript_54416/g.151588 Transcript_54416/m.151588 type:complete len:211 (+) Transcript_54416:867-1499(+)